MIHQSTSTTDAHWLPHRPLPARERANRQVRVTTTSERITMRDGTRIAIDLHLPGGPGVPPRMPAILRQTRYLRSLRVRPAVDWLPIAPLFDLNAEMRRTFLAAGYAWLDVDVRGTGASTGTWQGPWFDDQVRDGGELVDWIIAQPWSSGRVGSLGISYDGTTAETLIINRHTAVRAVAPLFSLHDIYTDVAFPGGIHLAWFTKAWSRYNALLDLNDFPEAMTGPLRIMARVAATSPRPSPFERLIASFGRLEASVAARIIRTLLGFAVSGVTGIGGESLPTPADLAERATNLDVHAGAEKIVFRDDTGLHPAFPERTIDSLSPHARRSDLEASGAAIYNYSGWRDAAYQNGAAKRWRDVPNKGSRLTLGPWAHTGKLRIHARGLGAPTHFDHSAELLDFFDEHLKEVPSTGDGEPVHYYVLGHETWRSAPSWPPPGVVERMFYFAKGGRLERQPMVEEGHDERPVDPNVGTGERSRWRSLLGLVPGDYPDRTERDRELTTFDGKPLDEEIVLVGNPVLKLFAAWSEPEAARVFAYLEDVAPDGSVSYVTEGQLAAIHRAADGVPTYRRSEHRPVPADEVVELTFELYPIAYAFPRGHSIRVALACADADHFAPVGARGTFRVHSGGARASRLVLPIVPSSATR